MNYENILTEVHGNVGLIRLNRPQALNALSPELMDELTDALRQFAPTTISMRWYHRQRQAFAAGADIKAEDWATWTYTNPIL
jgi:enoyl-CoA hydratase